MALPAAIVSLITVTTSAASIIGIIKRRCGASQRIYDVATKCSDVIEKMRELLKTLEDRTQVPHATLGISTALSHRQEEFDAVLDSLEKMKKRIKRRRRIFHLEKFILAQGWAQEMEAIHNDLVQVRNGIENIVANWGVAHFVVTKVEKLVTIDVTKKEESRWEQDAHCETMGCGTVDYIDQIQMTMVKLSDASKAALSRYGNLDKFSLPDALFEASKHVQFIDKVCYIQLLQGSAELLHPQANKLMGTYCEYGCYEVEINLDLGLSYRRVASSRGNTCAMILLMEHSDREKDKRNVLKYIEMACNEPMHWHKWIRWMQFAVQYSFQSPQLVQPLIESDKYERAFQQSICHFFGLGVPKNNQKAIDALQSFDSGAYHAHIDTRNLDRFFIRAYNTSWFLGKLCSSVNRKYADFLFKSSQFLPFLLFSCSSSIYSRREWKDCALHAVSSHCVDAHIFLAYHYAKSTDGEKRGIKRHLRIAADAGNPHAQLACRRLLGGRANFSKRLQVLEEKGDGNRGRGRQRLSRQYSERNLEPSCLNKLE